jgi:hypothetical protein
MPTFSPLKLDFNGDSIIDTQITPQPGKEVVYDTVPPEIQLSVATSTNSLQISATDNLTPNPVITSTTTYPLLKKNQTMYRGTATTTVTARDEAGNTTVLVYTQQFPSKDRRIAITPISISYNGATTTLTNTNLKYKWQLNNPTSSYKMLASYLQTTATTTESHWRPKKNQTILMSKPTDLDEEDADDNSDTRPTKTKLYGFVVPYLTTQKGKIIISY